MKRFAVTIFAVIYLAITSGVLINVHYCMGEIAAVAYGHDTTSGCEKCGMESKEGCCSTETAFVKVSEQQKSETTASLNAPLLLIIHTGSPLESTPPALHGVSSYLPNHSPPALHSQSLNVLYRNFRI